MSTCSYDAEAPAENQPGTAVGTQPFHAGNHVASCLGRGPASSSPKLVDTNSRPWRWKLNSTLPESAILQPALMTAVRTCMRVQQERLLAQQEGVDSTDKRKPSHFSADPLPCLRAVVVHISQLTSVAAIHVVCEALYYKASASSAVRLIRHLRSHSRLRQHCTEASSQQTQARHRSPCRFRHKAVQARESLRTSEKSACCLSEAFFKFLSMISRGTSASLAAFSTYSTSAWRSRAAVWLAAPEPWARHELNSDWQQGTKLKKCQHQHTSPSRTLPSGLGPPAFAACNINLPYLPHSLAFFASWTPFRIAIFELRRPICTGASRLRLHLPPPEGRPLSFAGSRQPLCNAVQGQGSVWRAKCCRMGRSSTLLCGLILTPHNGSAGHTNSMRQTQEEHLWSTTALAGPCADIQGCKLTSSIENPAGLAELGALSSEWLPGPVQLGSQGNERHPSASVLADSFHAGAALAVLDYSIFG